MEIRIIFLSLLLCSTGHAKEFTFTFHYPYGTQSNKLVYKTDAKDWDEAFKRAASFCAKKYAEISNLDEETKLDIIDACVNPR